MIEFLGSFENLVDSGNEIQMLAFDVTNEMTINHQVKVALYYTAFCLKCNEIL